MSGKSRAGNSVKATSSTDVVDATAAAVGSSSENTDSMTEAQRRLFNIRMKINQGRKANKSEVEDEYQRFNDPKYEQKQAKQRYIEKVKEASAAGSSAKVKGGNGDDDFKLDPLLQQTAEQAAFEKEKRERKQDNIATFGWQAFTVEATHKAYEKRLKKLPTASSSSSRGGETSAVASAATKTGSTIAPLDYGAKGSNVPMSALERLSQDVSNRKEAVQKNSKRRKAVDGEDVDYINDRNAAFNKKIKRSFDKYTVEIRQNLERGTAV